MWKTLVGLKVLLNLFSLWFQEKGNLILDKRIPSKTSIIMMMTNSDWCKLQGWDNPKKDFQSQSWKVKIFANVSSVIWSLFKMGWNFIVQISGLGGSRICFVIEEVTSLQSQSKDKVLSLLMFVAQFSVAGLEKL